MIKASFRADTSQYQRAVNRLAVTIKKDFRSGLRSEMGLLVKRLVELTPPASGRGTGVAAKRLGEAAVSRDIQRVFFSIPRSMAVDRALHEARRDKRGRVHKSSQKDMRPAGQRELKQYINEKQRHVGRLKAGWLAGAGKFGTKGIPAWVRRHGTSEGSAIDTLSVFGGYLEVENRNKAISIQNQESRIAEAAVSTRIRDIQNRINRIATYRTRRMAA